MFDFRDDEAVRAFAPIDDRVMGGVSRSRLEATGEGTAAFVGTVSFERGGGFASVRSSAARHDLRRFAGLELRVRGDGKCYKVHLKQDAALDGVLYRASFAAAPEAWARVRLPFASFEPTFRGRAVPDAPPLDLARVASVGLMVSDRQGGPFRLEIASIAGYED